MVRRFKPEDLVLVDSRMSPGENKPGGVAHVVKNCAGSLVEVKYVLGGKEVVEEEFVNPHAYLDRTNRRRANCTPPVRKSDKKPREACSSHKNAVLHSKTQVGPKSQVRVAHPKSQVRVAQPASPPATTTSATDQVDEVITEEQLKQFSTQLIKLFVNDKVSRMQAVSILQDSRQAEKCLEMLQRMDRIMITPDAVWRV